MGCAVLRVMEDMGVGGDAWAVQYQTPCEYCHLHHKG